MPVFGFRLDALGVAALVTACFGAITGTIATWQSWKAKRDETEAKRGPQRHRRGDRHGGGPGVHA